jgi:hypothetical protein
MVREDYMKWLESMKEERLRKKEEDQELLDLYEEIIRRFYIGPGFS